jgi:hypothetical protein
VSRRALTAASILVLWLGGIAALTRRELFRGDADRLAQAALLVAPGVEYYAITQHGAHVGWGSSSVDTMPTGLIVRDVLIADARGGRDSGVRRLAARSIVHLTRGMRLTDFAVQLGGAYGPYEVSGTMTGDTLLTLVTRAGGPRADTSRVPVRGPLLLPTTVPIALALTERPKIGRSETYLVFDPVTGKPEPLTVQVRAESLFVLADSARLDGVSGRWVAAHQDTVRGWRLEQQGGGLVSGWIDEKGRTIQATPLGRFDLRRTAYEMAFQNWSLAGKRLAADSLDALPPRR